MSKKHYSLQRRIQIYVVITILLVALISSFISGYIYFRSSINDFYKQTDSTLTYFENVILRQKLRESNNVAASLAALPETTDYYNQGLSDSLPTGLTHSIQSGNSLVVFLDAEFKQLYSTADYDELNHGNFTDFLKRRLVKKSVKQLSDSRASKSDLTDPSDYNSANNVQDELSTTAIPDESFYYGDLMGNFYAMSFAPVRNDDVLNGYIIAGYDLTDPAYTEYISRYFGLISTIFYQDIRINTNLENASEDYLHTTLDDNISNQLFYEGKSYSGQVELSGIKYIGTYRPLSDNINTAGAVFVGIGLSDLLINQRLALYPIAATSLIIILAAIILTRKILNKHIGQPIGKTIELLQKMAADPASLAHEDISEIGEKNLNSMVQSLKSTAAAIAQDRDYLSYLAFHDRLTGLYNSKRLFDYYGEREKSISQEQYKAPAIAATANIDFFKRHKKYLGQQGSEKLLLAVSVKLSQVARKYNCDIYRLTSDEFIICCDTVFSNDVLDDLLIDLLSTLHEPIRINGKNLMVSISIGVARREAQTDTLQDIMQKSSMALNTAKYAGRNRYEHYDPKTAKVRQRYLKIEEKLRGLQNYKCFELYYQPQIDLKSGDVYGLEALIRWHDHELGWISPSEFIPLAEAIGMINPIGNWVTSEALKFLNKINSIGITDLHMSINIAAAQIIEPDFVIRMLETARLRNINPARIVLEITETQLIQSFENAIDNLKQLRDYGFLIAMDDFGTGFSSLSYIGTLPLNIIKIDQSFIQSMDNSVNLELIKEMLRLGKRLGLVVISEGVETADQLNKLEEVDGKFIQGYYISKPKPEEEMLKWLEHKLIIIRESDNNE